MPSEAEIFAHAKTVIRTLPRLAYQNSLQNAKTALRFAKVEFRPPSIAEISKATTTFTKIMDPQVFSKRLPNLTVGEAWLNALVCAEIFFLFFVGEIIGRRSVFGYHLRGHKMNVFDSRW